VRKKTTFIQRAAYAATPYERARRFLSETVWQIDPAKLDSRWKRWGIIAARVVYLSGRGLASSRTQLQAAALTYTTILALVPLFAVVFSLFQGFGGLQGSGTRLENFLVKQLAASPDQEALLHEHLKDFVAKTQESLNSGGSIAGVALIFLIFTVITLLSSIESTLNQVWGVKRNRTFTQKFIIYWAIATLSPVLLSIALVAGTTVTTKARAWSPSKLYEKWKKPAATGTVETPRVAAEEHDFYFTGVGGALAARHLRLDAAGAEGALTPREELQFVITGRLPTAEEVAEQRGLQYTAFFLTAIAFSLLYAFMPNTKVHMRPALIGGFFAAWAWQTSKWALATGSTALVKYNTIYGGLATIPILMFWFYISWLIVILGAELTFAIQNLGSQGREELANDASPRCREVVALRLMSLIGEAFSRGVDPQTLSKMAKQLGAPVTLVSGIVFHLCEDGLLREIEVAEEDRGYVPGRPLASITVAEIARSIRDRSGINFSLEGGPDAQVLEAELARADAAEQATIGQVTLDDVVRSLQARTGTEKVDTVRHAVRPAEALTGNGGSARPGEQQPASPSGAVG
jgi:uncharacterized BrkB/YihY/UPF0761 family membrane protein